MILKGQYFCWYQKGVRKIAKATGENKDQKYVGWGDNNHYCPITVRYMFELLECPVPEGAKVYTWSPTSGEIDWYAENLDGSAAVILPDHTMWLEISGPRSPRAFEGNLDLSNLPVTDEVIESLPEPLQKKWKELK